jgi:hypothetical protein
MHSQLSSVARDPSRLRQAMTQVFAQAEQAIVQY